MNKETQNEEALDARRAGPRLVRLRIALAFAVFVLIGLNDSVLGILLPGIQGAYHITPATVGLIFLAATCGYLSGSLSVGSLIAHAGLRRVLLGGALIYIGGASLITLAPPYPLVLCAFVMTGFGMACLDAGLNAYMVGLPNNTMLLNYLHAFFGLGAWLGPLLATGVLALDWQWGSTYLVMAVLCVVILLGIFFSYEKHVPNEAEEAPRLRALFAGTLRLRVVQFAIFFLIFYGGVEVALGSWSYSFLTGARLALPLYASWMVSGYWLGLTGGRIVLGWFSQRVGNTRLIQGCLLGSFVGLLLTWWSPTPLVAALGLFLTGFSLGPIFPTTFAIMGTRVPPLLLPNVIGLLASQGNIGGAIFSWGAGNVTQYLGLNLLLPFILLLTLGMQLAWLGVYQRPKPHM
ncbi:MFS transporter [Ktedonospora formicarum]|uniref:Major facilitator superfamily (MFS) profile domain-containing protein n=1 Tax=Ktedonospora formicarum TaxID=2778364 RepID=A0A8J3I9U3_9CHLR|nr:MFS transporter [Ktedonospora formicarum]GHO48139.1 hypothetical protein KSX_63020 [Ktedonospora formicarum]